MNRRGFLTGLVSSLVAAPAVVSSAYGIDFRCLSIPTDEITRFMGFDIVYSEWAHGLGC